MNPPFGPRPPLSNSVKATPREKILAQWRGQNIKPLEIAGRSSARPASQVMKGVLSGLKIDRKRSETEIVKAWNHLMDPNIAAHAQPVGIHNGTLMVTVDSHVWLDEIVRYKRKEILTRLHHCFGTDLIKKISFRVGA